MSKRSRALEEDRRLATRPPTSPLAGTGLPLVVDLQDRRATNRSLTGAKAAVLAAAWWRGLPVLPGLVLTTAADAQGRVEPGDGLARTLRPHWERLSRQGALALAVRSSSTVEDGATSSMAGMFTSVLDVSGWSAFCDAVGVVLRSAGPHPMAVLVQPMLAASTGGVLFGLDPVTGQSDRLVVEAVEGAPGPLVGGLVAGTRHVLSRRGRLLEADEGGAATRLRRRQRRVLAELAAATATTFGGPQDIEWAFDADGGVWLLQSRPVTAREGPAVGPVLGPGPVAETFPEPLRPLEIDLWVEPLRVGVTRALEVVGATPRRALSGSPVVTTVGGRVAADLSLLGPAKRGSSVLARLDPRPPARRLAAAWRVGRLRRAAPLLAADVCADIDAELEAVPNLGERSDDELMSLIGRSRQALRAIHGHEALAGILAGPAGDSATGAALALEALGAARAHGLDDTATIAAHPVVLALQPPALGTPPELPATASKASSTATPVDRLGAREALRLRSRWLQELTARAVAELAGRLHFAHRLGHPSLVAWLRLDELAALSGGGHAPPDLARRASSAPGPPLPVAFRLTAKGSVVAERPRRSRQLQGRGAGGGRGMGPVHDPAAGSVRAGGVLVVRTLEPGLAATLPGMSGLVAETGSVLSHLAILARELGVPTVVGVDDAVRRFPPGVAVVVDGTTGEVARVDGEATRPDSP